ncbi:nitroreductase [Thalassobius vesicularis]|uniref:Nitroreductase n=1 Tax=Thalassobius vesicularis TaxID=1294297 RepID=A0A4V3UZA2_9RHOB|nr:nitroreductase [Thalassobius vesicularis]THD75859.1 nitroreductase [Thalassobius vesicularis]
MTEEFDAFDALMHRRHSCRGFRPDPVPRDVVERIVRAASRVPTWCNAQPWQVIVTDGAETDRFRDVIHAAASSQAAQPDLDWPKQYLGVYQDRRRTCGLQLYDAVGVTRGDRVASGKQMMENYRLFGAPHVAIVTSEADLGTYGVMDCGGFVAAFTVAAEAVGVASIAQAAVAAFAPTVRAHFGIPDNRLILCAISFGYEDTSHPANGFRTARADMDEVIDWR